MKIGINLIALYDEQGTGAFRYIKLLLKKMGDYNLIDCKFYIYKQKQISIDYLDIPLNLNVEYINVPNVGRGFKRIIFEQTFFYFYLKKCDVFYSYCTSMPLFVRGKRAFTLHDIYYLTLKERYGFLQRTYLYWFTKIYAKRSDIIFTVSNYSKKEIIAHLGVPEDKLIITYNFLLSNSIDNVSSKRTIVDIYGNILDNDAVFFLYVGNLQPGKNIKGLVEGFKLFVEKNPDYYLVLVGKPAFQGESIIDYLKGRENVFYLGFQSRENLEYLYSKCIAVTLLSFCEGFGIPPLEGFNYGKPALTSNATSLPEVVGKAGVLADPYNVVSISNGFSVISANIDECAKHIPEQLDKFNADQVTKVFMEALGITYIEKQ